MAERDVIEALGRVEGELRVSRHQDVLKKYPPRLRKALEVVLLESNPTVRELNLQFLGESLPDGYANRIRDNFTADTVRTMLHEYKGQFNKALNPFEPLDDIRRLELEAYEDEVRAQKEAAVEAMFAEALEQARRQDRVSNPKLKGDGINTLSVKRDIAQQQAKINVRSDLLRKEAELQQDRHIKRLQANNPLLPKEDEE
ncbi:hypothetical protein [Chroococcidiopsis sp. CCMEE 29]|uniref:hypothetical protein n=1 Tax=Chroococcidiopsis sp. CCMEE 29 TaxID=155894 RepID=UPI0020211A07|nr:hypothetical protein [Chroococcidiopsis sp. CCMEE 29]